MRGFFAYLFLLLPLTAGAQIADMLQTAIEGKGQPFLILTGQGYEDVSKYASDTDAAIAAIFSKEPMTEFRNCFNIISVSPSDYGCKLDGEMVVGKDGDASMNERVSNAFPLPGRQAFYVILIDTDECAASTLHEDWAGNGHTFSYISLYGGSESPSFRQAVIHEVCGHAIGKLADEYVFSEESCPGDELAFWVNHPEGKGLNLSPIRTSEFRYEGGLGYARGVWRSSPSSIMSDTDTPGMEFNAASLKALELWLNKICKSFPDSR